MPVAYPNESASYRTARNGLLAEEVALRAQVARVAEMRRNLPTGGPLKEDYAFTGLNGEIVSLSNLFSDGTDTLAIYSLMFRPDADAPCPMCASLLDGLNGQANHIGQHMDIAIVAAATPEQLQSLGAQRDWGDLALLSAQDTSYQADYHGEMPDGAQIPMMNIFRKSPTSITHFWGSEGFFADVPGHPRHLDQLWPLWNMLDLTPAGRGADWYPGLSY